MQRARALSTFLTTAMFGGFSLWHPIRRSPHPSRLNVVVFAPELPPFLANHPDATHKQKEDPLNFMNGTWPREGQSLKAEDTDKKREKVGPKGCRARRANFFKYLRIPPA